MGSPVKVLQPDLVTALITPPSAPPIRVDSSGLYLHLLQVFEHGVLPGASVDQAVGGHTVHGEDVFGAAGAVHLESAFNLARVHARCGEREGLKAPAFRQPVEFFSGHVVRERDAGEVELLGRFRRDVDDFRERAGPKLRIDADRSSRGRYVVNGDLLNAWARW